MYDRGELSENRDAGHSDKTRKTGSLPFKFKPGPHSTVLAYLHEELV